MAECAKVDEEAIAASVLNPAGAQPFETAIARAPMVGCCSSFRVLICSF